jgi:hypothetical protein
MSSEDMFGFTAVNAVTEDELKIEQSRAEGVYRIIMPLLTSLLEDEDKSYLYWPNRKEKIELLIKKIEATFTSK